jgi:diguanylate cyclase (GGDEF)-like protein
MKVGGLPTVASMALAALRKSSRLDGAAIIDMTQPESSSVVVFDASFDAAPGVADAIGGAYQMLRRCPDGPSYSVGSDRRPILVSPLILHPDRRAGLALWRKAGVSEWDERDADFATSVAAMFQQILENRPGEATTDCLTGLRDRAYFFDQVNRHIDRLEQDGASGTMLLIDMDGLRRVNADHGRALGDALLIRTANVLRAIVRPVDIVARVGGDEFAVWLDNVDHMTAAERAVLLGERRLALPESAKGLDQPEAVGGELTLSIGIAGREPGNGEDARALLRRAHKALWEAKQSGGGAWSVSHIPTTGWSQ